MTTVYGASHVRRRRTKAQLAELDAAITDAIAEEHPVTLRGVFYRLVSAGAVEKTERGYQAVGRELLKLRRAGTVPYAAITDGTRLIRKSASYDDVEQMLTDAAASYRRALWRDQQVEVMVFTEKDAISGVLFPVTNAWDVPLGVMRGYASETFAYAIAAEIALANRRGKRVYVYQFGDHDPSGVGAWRDFESKVRRLACELAGRVDACFERLAVTGAQIADLALPTRPTKTSDTRARSFAGESVEVDAIPASLLREIVERAITRHIDADELALTRLYEEGERELLVRMTQSLGASEGER